MSSSFKKVQLGEVVSIQNGYAFKSGEYTSAGHFLMRIKNVQDGEITLEDPKYVNSETVQGQFELDVGDILMSLTGNIGRVGLVRSDHLPAALNQRVACIKPKDVSNLDNNYLFHFLKSDNFRRLVSEGGRGIAQQNVSTKSIAETDFSLPPLPEQKRIAAILDKADAIRRKRQETLTLTESLIQSTFLDMFGDPVTNPKGWEEAALKELIISGDKINYGVVQPGKEYPNGVPLVRAGDLNVLEESGEFKLIDPAIDHKHRKSRLVGDEILIGCVGAIGSIGMATLDMKGYNIARAVARVRPSSKVNRTYLAAYFATGVVQNYFKKEVRQVAQPTLNIKQIEETKILLPPKNMQSKFSELFEKIKSLQSKELEDMKESDNLSNSLQQRAFRGELSLN